MNTDLERDLAALLDTIADDAEGAAIAELFAIAGRIEVADTPDDSDTPFVYPH